MIKAIITLNSGQINKHITKEIVLPDERTIAIRRKNEETNKIEEITVGDLFDLFSNRKLYKKTGPLVDMDFNMFYEWFTAKYISGKSIQSSIINIKFEQN